MGFQFIRSRIPLGRLRWGALLGFCFWLGLLGSTPAKPVLDASDPVGFFTTIADKLLRNTFSFGETNIPVCTNGALIYSPSVQRLLQLSANIYEATTTNFYPAVFRPQFFRDAAGNVFITGYQQVVSVNGLADPQLALPMSVDYLPPGNSTNVNVYGVPWIIGAKKGLPNFNEFYMRNAVQVSRRLQVSRTDVTRPGATATNQMFVFSITNRLGFSFWNSYSAPYVGSSNLTIHFNDFVEMTLTNNGPRAWSSFYHKTFTTNLTSWPGSGWTNGGIAAPENQYAAQQSFVAGVYDFPFLPVSVFRASINAFEPIASDPPWETNYPSVPVLPQFGLQTTNWLQAFILDGSHVIDYVQFSGPNSSRSLNSEINDPFETGTHYYMWSTNRNAFGTTYGVANQIMVSRRPSLASGISWALPSDLPFGINTPTLAAQYFDSFFTGLPMVVTIGGRQTFLLNTNLIELVPYTPTRTAWEFTLWQANDPLVHYVASNLNTMTRDTGLHRSDDLVNSLFPSVSLTTAGERYQPWGRNHQMAYLGYSLVDTNSYNLRFRDPLVWNSDSWNFPAGEGLPLTTLGRIHRGTPWQTVYLKARDVLREVYVSGGLQLNVGTNTWMQWTGNLDSNDAALSAPTRDWQLLSLLIPLLNTNDPSQLQSVNSTNLADWLNALDGLVVLTNSTVYPTSWQVPQFDSFVMSSNSPQAALVADAIVQTRTNLSASYFQSIAEILPTFALSEHSPWLDVSSGPQQRYGISDEAYEAIPAQLLPRLRPDSFGGLVLNNGTLHLQFSGSDGCSYLVQTSTNLINWETISTNDPVQGSFILPITPAPDGAGRFYRSRLMP